MAGRGNQRGPDPDPPQGRALFLHLGVQKTGTTSLQRHLEQNEAALSDLLVIRTPREGSPMRPLGRAAIAFSLAEPGDGAARRALADALDAVLDGLPQDDRPILLSHENLAGAMPGNHETGLFPALPDLARLVFDGAAARGMRPHAVVYTRRMAQWLPSVWAQAVRTDGYAGDWDAFRRQTDRLPGWGNLIRRLQAALGPDAVTRLRVEDEDDPAHPGRALLRLAGLDPARIDALAPLGDRGMERLSDSSTEFLRRLNGLALNPHARDRVAKLVARSQPLFAAHMPSEGTL